MSVTIAVPGIPADQPWSAGDGRTQDGGVIAPGLSMMKVHVSIAGGDVGVDFHPADYGLERFYLYGLNFNVQGNYNIDVSSTLYTVPIHYTLNAGDTSNATLELRFLDAPTTQVEVWALGPRLHP